MSVKQCPFCKGTGQHLCPDVAEPILIKCSHKDCTVNKEVDISEMDQDEEEQ